MSLPDIPLTAIIYLLSKAIPTVLILTLLGITVHVTLSTILLYRKRNFTFSIHTIVTPVLLISALLFFSYRGVATLTTDLKEVWTEDTITEIVQINTVSKPSFIIPNQVIETDKVNLQNIQSEWYVKEGYQYEITYYKTSKVITDVNKIENQN